MADRQDAAIQHTRTASPTPFIVGLLCYALVALALYFETGNLHVGQSWPVVAGVTGVIVGFLIEQRYVAGDTHE